MTIRPDPNYVERVIREEAKAAGADPDAVMNLSKASIARRARYSAMQRIARETGAGPKAISEVWGCAEATVGVALGRAPQKPSGRTPPVVGVYDAMTIARLTWAHGPERTAEIVAGRDAATNADIAAWRRLGADR